MKPAAPSLLVIHELWPKPRRVPHRTGAMLKARLVDLVEMSRGVVSSAGGAWDRRLVCFSKAATSSEGMLPSTQRLVAVFLVAMGVMLALIVGPVLVTSPQAQASQYVFEAWLALAIGLVALVAGVRELIR